MPKNCLVEYLTPACASCPDWADGTDNRGIGCATHFPIMECVHFAKMYQEESESLQICKDCDFYNKAEKICTFSGKHTARKNKCSEFTWRW